MEIPLNVQVECTDGVCGRSIFVLIDPVIERLTHLIVGDELSNLQQEVSNYIWNHGYGWEKSYYWPYVVSAKRSGDSSVQGLSIPVKEMAIGRGTRVEASDGYVGNVDEFVVNPENGTITHMMMREGHLWGKKDVIIPLSAMGETREGTMFLNLDKHQIESLPTIPVHRLWS